MSFAIALAVVVIGQIYLPVPAWTRAFLALGTIFLVSATFTLAKCVRDQQETETVLSRLDQARLERLLAEFDPYRVPTVADLTKPAPTGRSPVRFRRRRTRRPVEPLTVLDPARTRGPPLLPVH